MVACLGSIHSDIQPSIHCGNHSQDGTKSSLMCGMQKPRARVGAQIPLRLHRPCLPQAVGKHRAGARERNIAWRTRKGVRNPSRQGQWVPETPHSSSHLNPSLVVVSRLCSGSPPFAFRHSSIPSRSTEPPRLPSRLDPIEVGGHARCQVIHRRYGPPSSALRRAYHSVPGWMNMIAQPAGPPLRGASKAPLRLLCM